ncbi:rhodanese-like domain-containing protein [Adhaeribacter aquaticus]|uniref:rhodanese-like domain-containing protein n=1 Tax=Adhaeribacter aquaticus TaxID=299567 RepID=UPI0004216763|nr:rhodanese-like domain-containing protein [Adhaeribacter aquaticus]
MKKNFQKLVFIFLFLVCQSSFSQTPDKAYTTISTTEFQKLIQKRKTTLLDVRTPEEFQKSHLKGAININYNDPNFKNLIQGLDKKKKILVYCASGRRSAKSCDLLQESNFKNIYNLDGGINAWLKESLPIEEN